jgi:branched-chain amino acid transport system permease protein
VQVDTTVNFLIGLAGNVAVLLIAAIGLAVIFGLMGVINFAHGEFLMLGAFATLTGVHSGLPVGIAMLVAPIAVGLFGIVVERLLIRRLYGRLEATMLATFGLSLILVQLAVLVWGNESQGIATPLGSVRVGQYTIAEYRFVLIAAAVLLVTIVYLVFTRTRFGLIARAVTERPQMASSLGVAVSRVNMVTFGFGCALAGAAGALMAPIVGVVPSMGGAFVAKAFMTVVVGGPGVVTGTVASSGLLGGAERIVTGATSPFVGTAFLLVLAIGVLRVMPTGLSGRWKREL